MLLLRQVFCIITRDRFLHVFEKEKGGFMDFAGMLQNHGPGGNVRELFSLFDSMWSTV